MTAFHILIIYFNFHQNMLHLFNGQFPGWPSYSVPDKRHCNKRWWNCETCKMCTCLQLDHYHHQHTNTQFLLMSDTAQPKASNHWRHNWFSSKVHLSHLQHSYIKMWSQRLTRKTVHFVDMQIGATVLRCRRGQILTMVKAFVVGSLTVHPRPPHPHTHKHTP